MEERNWMVEIPRAPLRTWAQLENWKSSHQLSTSCSVVIVLCLFYSFLSPKFAITFFFFLDSRKPHFLKSIFYEFRWVSKTSAIPSSSNRYTSWLELETCYTDLKPFVITLRSDSKFTITLSLIHPLVCLAHNNNNNTPRRLVMGSLFPYPCLFCFLCSDQGSLFPLMVHVLFCWFPACIASLSCSFWSIYFLHLIKK